jgi:hypothetical protein
MITLVLAILGWTCQVQLPAVFTSWGAVPYDCQVANGGPATWTVTAGTLPEGLVLDPQTGLLSQPPVGPNAPTDLSITVVSLGEKTLGPEPSGGKPLRRAVPGLLKNGTLFGVV